MQYKGGNPSYPEQLIQSYLTEKLYPEQSIHLYLPEKLYPEQSNVPPRLRKQIQGRIKTETLILI